MAGDPFYSSTVLILPMSGANGSNTFTDYSKNPKTPTVAGNIIISTAQHAPLTGNTACAALDGAADYLRYADSTDFGFGTGDFTLEIWVYLASDPAGDNILFDFRTAGAQNGAFYIDGAASQRLAYYNGAVLANSGASVPIGAWTHVAFVRTAGSMKAYLNGVAQWTIASAHDFTSSRPFTLGANYANVSTPNGYFDDVRITKAARYTADFSVPTVPNPTTSIALAGNIVESVGVTDWRVTAIRCSDGSTTDSVLTSGSTYSLSCGIGGIYPHNIILTPKIDKSWVPLTTVVLGEYWIPTNLTTHPILLKCTTAGVTGSTEPTWSGTSTFSDGSVVWTYIDTLPNPVSLGPKIPS